jgi:DNA-binding beta-propeller fold protein YncE
MRALFVWFGIAAGVVFVGARAFPQDTRVAPLKLERTIRLEGVEGRIDHLSIDAGKKVLFVAALGNNTLEAIDLAEGRRIKSVQGLREPQGVLYAAPADRVFVANAKDGSVRIYDGKLSGQVRSIPFGDDADNLRLDASSGHVFVGYGGGALGEMDADGARVGDVKLGGHPESFQLERNGSRIFVNVPSAREVAVVDRKTKSVVAKWGMGLSLANYPMALDEADHRLFVVCRMPARLIVLNTDNGSKVSALPTVGDADDVFYDSKRKRIYVIGGEGAVAVVAQNQPDRYQELGRVKTAPGARTGFFSPDLDRLFVAVRKGGDRAAEVRVYSLGD